MKIHHYPTFDSCKNATASGRWAILTGGILSRAGTAARLMLVTALAGLATALMPFSATAAAITWGTPAAISGDTDVSANGTPLYAYYLGSGNQTVNGVTFTGSSGSTAWGNVSFTSGFSGSSANCAVGAYINPSTAYSNVLNGCAYGGATAGTVTLNGLTVGQAYGVQIWVNDSRVAGAGRTEVVSNSVASTATLDYNDFDVAGGIGQYVVGTFVADGPSQSFSLSPATSVGTAQLQLNAISVRDLGGPLKTWLGSSDTSWATGANWSPSGAPINGQSVVFNESSTANLATIPDQNYTLATLTLSNAPSAVSIGASGYSLTINDGVNVLTAGQTLTLNDPVVLGGFQTWTNNGNLTVNAGISGSAALTLAGTGVTTFTQPATYLYKTTVSGGTLALGGSGSLTSANITVAGGAIFDVSAQSPSFTLNGRTLTESSSGAVLNGALDCTSGTLAFTLDGLNPGFIQTNGTLTISSATVISINIPGTSLSAGSYTLIAASATGNVGQVTVSDSLPSVILTGNGAVGQASLAIDGSGNLNLVIAAPSVWTGASNGNWSNGGNWSPANEPNPTDSILFNNLSTANLTISQDDTLSGGVIYGLSLIDPAGSVTIGGPGGLTVYGGGFNLSSASHDLTISAPLVINATQNWLVTNSRTLTISGPLSSVSGGNITVSGGGTLKMGAAHVLDNLTNNAATCDFTVNGGTLDLNGNSQAMNGLNCGTNAVIDNSGAGAATLIIGGNGDNSTNNALIKNTGGPLALQANGGVVILSSSNSYTGGSTFNGAQLSFPSSSALGTGPITFNPGSSIYSFAVTFTNALTLNGGYLRLGGNNNAQTWSGPITVQSGFSMSGDNSGCQINLSGPINIGTGGVWVTNFGNEGPQGVGGVGLGDVLSGTITGSGGITYYCNGGNSRLTVQGANIYSGGTIVSGTPDINGSGKLNVFGGINPFSTGLVTLNSGAIVEAYPGNVTITNALTLNGGTLQSEPQYNNYNQLTWSGPVTLTADSALCQNGSKTSTGSGDNQSSGVKVTGPLNIGGFTLGSYGNYNFYGGNTLNGPISGAGNIVVTNNQLVISGTNTFSGTFRAVGGTLNVQNAYALQNATLDMNAADAGAVTFSSGLNAVIGAITGSRALNLGSGTVSIGNNNTSTTYTGNLTGNSLIKLGTGVLTLSSNAYTGDTTVSGGTLAITQPTLTFGSTVTVAAGAALKLDFNATNVVSALVLNGVSQPNGVYNSANSGGRITGTGAIQVGLSPYVWSGALSSEWSTNVLSAPRNWTFNSAQANYADGDAVLFDDSLTANSTVDISVANVSPATVTFNNNKTNYVVQGAYGIVGTAGLTLNGTSNVTLLTANSYAGNTTINAGSLTIGVGGNLGGGTYAGSIGIGTNATLEYSSATAQTLSGAISGAGSLVFDGATATTLTLSGPNTYSGSTVVGNANNVNLKLVLSSAPSVSTNTAYNILGSGSSGGTLYLNAAGTYPNSFTISGASGLIGAIVLGNGVNLSGPITLAGDSQIALLNAGSTSSTLAGRISGNYGLAFNGDWNSSGATGTKTFILANTGLANNYTGATTIQNNYHSPATYTGATTTVLKLGANEQIPNGTGDGLLTFQNGNNANRAVTFELNGYNETINGTSVASAANTVIQNTGTGASTLTIGDGDTTSTFSGKILDGGAGKSLAIAKIGAGTLTLSGANVYVGGTTVNAGTLALSGIGTLGSGAITVTGGATLDVSGKPSAFALGSGQTLTNSSVGAVLNGTNNCSAGTLALVYDATNACFIQTNGTMTLSASTVITVNNTGPQLVPGHHTIIAAATSGNAGQVTGTLPAVIVTGNGAAGSVALQINGAGGLDVVVTPSGPTLTSVTPNPVPGSSYPVTLSLTGSGFTGATAVLLTNLTTSTGFSYVPTVNNSTSISVSFVPATAASSWNATVVNGTPSGQAGFSVTQPTSVSINKSALTSAGAGKLVLSGSGGAPGNSYSVVSATNLTPPVVWSPVATNQFDGSGNFSYTNTVSTGTPKLFLRIQQ